MDQRKPIPLSELATDKTFDEGRYLAANPDIRAGIGRGEFTSGRHHFDTFGHREGRLQRRDMGPMKRAKFERIQPILRTDLPMVREPGYVDFLTPALRAQFGIVDTENVSSNEYDGDALALIGEVGDGLVLDCGAGCRTSYFDNVVNFEIVAYPTTDVCGAGEVLPFKDRVFDAVLSLAVLEHVKDPWQCAEEIKRVLKPGGRLMCCVPFLQPMHGYPHHYYNMTEQGLRSLFEDQIDITRHEVPASTLPIWGLSWILRSWAAGLPEDARREFEGLSVADLMADPASLLSRPWVTGLPYEKNMELASATVIHGRKRA
jgi:SAM-dependent methyltransferase